LQKNDNPVDPAVPGSIPAYHPRFFPQALAGLHSTLKGLVSATLLQHSGFPESFLVIGFLAKSLSLAETLYQKREADRGDKAFPDFLGIGANAPAVVSTTLLPDPWVSREFFLNRNPTIRLESADRYLKEHDDLGMVKIAAKNADAVLEIQENCALRGASHVAFDPIPRPVFVPISVIFEQLLKGPNSI
jgi:hypothetical protein